MNDLFLSIEKGHLPVLKIEEVVIPYCSKGGCPVKQFGSVDAYRCEKTLFRSGLRQIKPPFEAGNKKIKG